MEWISHSDAQLWLAGAALIVTAVLAALVLDRLFPVPGFWWRKLLHVIAVGTCAYVIGQTTAYLWWLGIVLVSAGAILVLILVRGYLQLGSDRSFGMAFFALALGGLILSGVIDQRYVATAAWVLAIADALAGIVGRSLGRNSFTLLTETKSIAGSMTFFCSTAVICVVLHPFLLYKSGALVLLLLLFTVSEALSTRGSDNVSIPVAVASLLMALNSGHLHVGQGWLVLAAALPALFVMVRRSWLTKAGGVAAAGLAAVLTLAFEALFLVLPLLFLVIGSLLSRLARSRDRDKAGRSAIQVLCNSLPAILAALWFGCTQDPAGILIALLTFGAALTDTVSSEIGRRYGGQPYDILRWRRLPAGVSGGVSLLGTAAGLIAALILPAVYSILYALSSTEFLIVVALSVAGMLMDSVLGSWLQAKYQVDGSLSDEGDHLVFGYASMTNDLVNLVSLCITALLGGLLLS